MPVKTRINAVLIAALLAASGLAAAGEASASKGASGQGDRQISWSFDAQDAGGAPAGAEVSGGVGLWTKADSQTCFDDVELETR